MGRVFLTLAALFGCLAVMLGAFGAHALSSKLSEPMLGVFKTAVDYQFWHVAALLAVGLLVQHWPNIRLLKCAGMFFVIGMLLFSGSLYLMTLAGIKLGVVTPIGGVCLMLGWLSLALSVWCLPRAGA